MTSPEPPPAEGKAGRNEARKLRATWLNNVSVAFTIAGVLQPSLAFAQAVRQVSVAEWVASAIFLTVGAALFFAAQAIVRTMED